MVFLVFLDAFSRSLDEHNGYIEEMYLNLHINNKISHIKLIMSEISADLKNLFWPQKPQIWKLKSDFIPIQKVFRLTAK